MRKDQTKYGAEWKEAKAAVKKKKPNWPRFSSGVRYAFESRGEINLKLTSHKLRASAKQEVSPTPSAVIEPGRLGVTAMRSSHHDAHRSV